MSFKLGCGTKLRELCRQRASDKEPSANRGGVAGEPQCCEVKLGRTGAACAADCSLASLPRVWPSLTFFLLLLIKHVASLRSASVCACD